MAAKPLPRPAVRGVDVDAQTRCAHYRTSLDIVAIRMKCCGRWYACNACHDALESHAIVPWPRREHTRHAVLCGGCGNTMSIAQYLACDDACPRCKAPFNPGCRAHHRLYFEMPRGT
ncbi:MAG TPA: CHY zinc finger protein [Rhizomicrobium sp.]